MIIILVNNTDISYDRRAYVSLHVMSRSHTAKATRKQITGFLKCVRILIE